MHVSRERHVAVDRLQVASLDTAPGQKWVQLAQGVFESAGDDLLVQPVDQRPGHGTQAITVHDRTVPSADGTWSSRATERW